MTLWLWIAFFLLIALLVAIDLGAVRGLGGRGPRPVRAMDGIASTALWVLAAVAVAVLLQQGYAHKLFGLGLAHDPKPDGHVWEQFLNAYLAEAALSIDNIAIFAMLFQRFHVRPAVRNRILFWSIITSLVIRALLINAGLSILHVAWIPWTFAAILFIAGFRALTLPDSQQAFEKRWLTRLAEKLPLWELLDPRDSRAPTLAGQSPRRIPVLLVIAVAVAADLALAIDSVPAVLAVTRDPTIAIAGATLAILALRSLYTAVADSLTRLRYWKLALMVILFGLGALHVSRRDGALPTNPHVITLSLLGLIGLGIGLSALRARRLAVAGERPTPLQDMADAVETSRRNFRKVLILIAGTVVIIFGLLIAPLPGPGPLVLVPIGLTILATEFIWAKKLLNQLKERTQQLQDQADRLARRSSPWLVAPVVIAYWSGMWAIWHYLNVKPLFLAPVAVASFLPIGYWAIRVLKSRTKTPPSHAKAKAAHSTQSPPSAAA